MPDADPGHADPEHDPTDDRGAHGSSHGHAATESELLGPVDVAAWAYALVGTGLGLLIVAVLFVASA